MAKTVPMERDGKTADVHPAEVEGMKAAGWTAAEKPKRAPRTAKKD